MAVIVEPLRIVKKIYQLGRVEEIEFRLWPPDRQWRLEFHRAQKKRGKAREEALKKVAAPERIVGFFTGWAGPADADGNPVPFTPEIFVKVCRAVDAVHDAAAEAVVEAVTLGVRGNSGPSPAGSTTGEGGRPARTAGRSAA